MLTANHQLDGELLKVELKGSINELVNLTNLIGPVPGSLEVDCKDILRINSMGLRAWINYFGNLRARGVQLRFTECSPAVVGCQNFVTNFVNISEIESISVPFHCNKCHQEFNETVNKSDITRKNLHVEPSPCPSCGELAELDEDETVFFAFLRNE